ncbi:hypothetical protein ACHAXT_010575 [Thalassiosira profunda]
MPFKWPIVGTLPDFFARGGADRLQEIYEQEMYAEFGSVYGMSIMGDDELIVSDPRVYDTVLRKEGKFPIGGAEGAVTFKEYYTETNNTQGIKSMSRDADWREWRAGLEADMVASWESYMPSIAATARKISTVAGYEVSEAKNIAFVDFISRSAFDLFATVMYGESPQTTNSKAADPEDIDFVKSTQTAFDLTGEIMLNPLEKVFGSDTYQLFKLNMEKTFDYGYKRAESYVEEMQRQNDAMAEDSGDASKCPVTAVRNGMNDLPFIGRLVSRGKMENEDIQSVFAPLLMAGVDTTAYVMSWLYLNLASNPEVQTKLAQELKAVLNGADVTTKAQLDSLPYLQACVRESHRLTPPAPVSQKKLKEDVEVVVGDTAYTVPAEARISLNLRAYPMDPRFVESPEQYMPERFLPEAIEARKGTPAEIIDHPSFADPFGRGKRRCLGANVAIAEIAVLAARLVQDWEIALADLSEATKWRPKMKLLMKADPYPAVVLTPRKGEVVA